jgi:hypothetical protein
MTLDTIIDLGQTLAVFASLIFVGYQIRQHTRALKATSHHAITDSFNALNVMLYSDPRVARIQRLGLAGLGNFDEDEALQFSWLVLANMRIFETLYYQYKTGTMEEQLYEAELNTLNWLASQPGFQAWWSANPISFSTEFRTFIGGLIREAKVAAELGSDAKQDAPA